MSVSLLVSNIKVTGSQLVYNANFSGIGGTQVVLSGGYILISGGAGGGGGVTQTQLDALSGFTTGISGYLQGQIGLSSAGVSQINGISGSITIAANGGLSVFNNGQIITISGNNLATSGDLYNTGHVLYLDIIGMSGSLLASISSNISGFITTGQADLRYYPLNSNPSGYVTSGQTGQFYPASNPQQYVTSGNLQSTGQQAWNVANNNAINLSGIIALTGSNLYNTNVYISGLLYTGIAQTGSNLYVLITGLSGQANLNYATITNLQLTGQSLYQFYTGLSGALTQSGIVIENQINSLSGFTTSISGYLYGLINNSSASLNQLSGQFTGFTGGFLSFLTGINPTGFDTYYINYLNFVFPTIPKVVANIELSGSINLYGFAISGRSITGFYTVFTDIIADSGVYLDVLVKV